MTLPSRAPAWSDDDVEALVAAVAAEPARRDELVALLREDSAVFAGRGSVAATRRRSWIIASFATVGLPPTALPYVLEDLESEVDPFAVAAAAHAVGGLAVPTPAVAAVLVDALVRLRARDDTVSLASLRPSWPVARPTTVLGELLTAIGQVGGAASGQRDRLIRLRGEHASTWSTPVRRQLDAVIAGLPHDCCAAQADRSGDPAGDAFVATDVDLAAVELEDQDGVPLTFDALLAGRRAVVAFFYTRCPNPNKCSLTISKLAELQGLLEADGLADRVRIAAITYDPGFDRPERMRRYGHSRGLRFTGSVRMLRATTGHELLRRHFGLRVGYVGSIVNRHAIELFLVDAGGAITTTWARAQWDLSDVRSQLLTS
jgi:protein SCO1/2